MPHLSRPGTHHQRKHSICGRCIELTSARQVAAPIANPALQAQLRDVMALCLADGVDAWDMLPDGRYVRPAVRVAEARLAAPLLGADEEYVQRVQVRVVAVILPGTSAVSSGRPAGPAQQVTCQA